MFGFRIGSVRRLVGRAGVVLLTPALVAACSVSPAGQAPVAPVSVKTVAVGPAAITGRVVYSGNVQARSTINVLPKISGQITKLNVDVGSAVKKGDVIAELDHAAIDAQVDQAQAGLAAAKAHLATIQAGPRTENVAQAKANLKAAQDTLAFMQSGGRPENVAAAQGQVDSATARVNSLTTGRADTITQAKANVAATQANLAAAQAKLQQLKDGPTQQQINAAQLAVEQAKDAANAANVAKDAACAYPSAPCNAAKAAAYAAMTGIDQANAQLKILTSPPTQDVLNQAQAAVDAAQAATNAAQAQLNLAERPGSSADIASAQGALQSAQAQLDLAKSPYSSADLSKAQAAVDIAQQQLNLAQAPFTQQDLDAAQAAVQQAQAALEMAQVNQSEAVVASPIDGVVSQKLLSVGSLAAPSTPIIVLIDPTVDAVVQADATQAVNYHNGDAATITSDALPAKSITGKIGSISPSVDPRTRTVQIKITPDSQDSGLKDGMLAQVAIVTATHQGVLAVPVAAVVQRNGQSTVYVVNNGVATPVAVQTGLSDGSNVEVTSGLQANQTVVVSGQDSLSTAQPVVVK
jgi:HlyD family secretion protein